jgi:outer membrane beta-barrel protein
MKFSSTLFLAIFCCFSAHSSEEKTPLWVDPSKKHYALSKKKYPKKDKIFLQAGYLSNTTSAFQETTGLQLKACYYFKEKFSVEIFHNNYVNANNENYENVKNINASVPFVRKIDRQSSAMIIHSPFYGKINTLNHVSYFDIEYGLGAGTIDYQTNLKTVKSPTLKDKYESKKTGTLNSKLGVKFHFKRNAYISAEILNTQFQAQSPANNNLNWQSNNDIIIGIGIGF